MKVVCINSKPIEIGNLYNDSLINLVEKEMYTLEKVVNDKYSTRKAFVLKEIKSLLFVFINSLKLSFVTFLL